MELDGMAMARSFRGIQRLVPERDPVRISTVRQDFCVSNEHDEALDRLEPQALQRDATAGPIEEIRLALICRQRGKAQWSTGEDQVHQRILEGPKDASEASLIGHQEIRLSDVGNVCVDPEVARTPIVEPVGIGRNLDRWDERVREESKRRPLSRSQPPL